MLIDNDQKYFINETLAGKSGEVSSVAIDHGNIGKADIADGTPIFCNIVIEDDVVAAGAAKVGFKIQSSDTEEGSDFIDSDIEIKPVPKAELVPGWSKRVSLPKGLKRYTRLVMTVSTGPLVGGQVSAFLTIN